MLITILGTLPPIKGISESYCVPQVKSLSKKNKINFIDFKSIYPELLYPGGSSKDNDAIVRIKSNRNLEIKNLLTWYNPFSWVFAGLAIKGEILHFHWWTFVLFPVFFVTVGLAKLRKKKIVCTVHNILAHESGRIDKIFSNWIFKLPDHFIVHSEANKKKLKETFRIKNEIISVIPYGSLNLYKKKNLTKLEARKKLKIKRRDKVVLYFGNIRKYKGVDVLIEAFVRVKKRIPKAKLIIAGKNWIDWQLFRKLIDKNGLRENLILQLDYIPSSDVQYYFSVADVVVLPYLHFDSQSGIGNIALAFGKAMVVTDVGGLPELVKEKSVIVRPDEKKLARIIIKILRDKKFRKKLERDSKELSQKYSWDGITEKTIKLYKLLLRRKK